MKLKTALLMDQEMEQLRYAERERISRVLDSKFGTSLYPKCNYTDILQTRDFQNNLELVGVLKELLRTVRHPSHIQWLVRCLPLKQVFDGSFLEEELYRVEYKSTLDGWGDTISRSKMTGVEGLIRKVLEDPEIEHRDKMFWILAAPGRLPKEEARKHVLDFIPIGPGVAAEAIRKIAEPEDLATFENLLESKLDPWDKKRIETTVKQLRKRFQKE